MLAVSFAFTAGRYHATPWEHHVNEGAVAWPPEPLRILRALIATWHHKVKNTGTHEEATLLSLIESLSAELPEYRLPAASHSHTRHYMPQFASGKTSLVLDAFAAIARDDSVVVIWPNIDLPEPQRELLDDLLAVIGYLGRAESWIEARRIDDPPAANCVPGDEALDTSTGELRGEEVSLYAPLTAAAYRGTRDRFLPDKKAIKKLGSTLPENLLDALSVDTASLRKQGWSQPPAARKVAYIRPVDALRPKRRPATIARPTISTACFQLIGKPLPRAEDSLRIGELMRQATMACFGKDENGRHLAPALISGHGLPEGNRHHHAFYLPFDSTGDGRIDRVLIHVPGGIGEHEQQKLDRLKRLWERNGGEWQLIAENVGGPEVGGTLTAASAHWVSVTPYLHPWHVKKGFSIEDQIRRECRERGLPDPTRIEPRESVRIMGRDRNAMHFRRFRTKRGLSQPDRHGTFWAIEFPAPIAGPLALGFSCHFGLGLFRPSSVD